MSLRLTGDWALEAVPADELDSAVEALADRIAGVPLNQLAMQKMMINQAYDNMGLQGTQVLATLFDGITRHSPEGRWFKDFAERDGFHAAVQYRDFRTQDSRRRRAAPRVRHPSSIESGCEMSSVLETSYFPADVSDPIEEQTVGWAAARVRRGLAESGCNQRSSSGAIAFVVRGRRNRSHVDLRATAGRSGGVCALPLVPVRSRRQDHRLGSERSGVDDPAIRRRARRNGSGDCQSGVGCGGTRVRPVAVPVPRALPHRKVPRR